MAKAEELKFVEADLNPGTRDAVAVYVSRAMTPEEFDWLREVLRDAFEAREAARRQYGF